MEIRHVLLSTCIRTINQIYLVKLNLFKPRYHILCMNKDNTSTTISFMAPDNLYENCWYEGDELACPKSDDAGW